MVAAHIGAKTLELVKSNLRDASQLKALITRMSIGARARVGREPVESLDLGACWALTDELVAWLLSKFDCLRQGPRMNACAVGGKTIVWQSPKRMSRLGRQCVLQQRKSMPGPER